jgi:formate hydrogenlyase subunit 6/NADH:ubiquinone oxidoreductase subunit I
MAHRTSRSGYTDLVERLNRHPQGAPPSDLLYRILQMLFSEHEAELVAQVPIKPFTAGQAARAWRMPIAEARAVLDELAGRAILLDVESNRSRAYVLPPPMAGFFEFSMMRFRGDLDQRVLAELFYEYMNVEEEFIKSLFTRGETQLGRAYVSEPSLPPDSALHVLDYERASHVVESASHIGVGVCYCRHKMEHNGRACDAPMEICMTFNSSAASLTDRGLVQFGENVQKRVNFICNCCGCCCEAMIAARRFGHLHPVHTTNFLPEVATADCTGCGTCVSACPVEAMTLVSANEPAKAKRKKARLEEDICLGCAVCVAACPEENITLTPRCERVITPVDSMHRTGGMAIDRGKLQHLLFANRALASHRAMAAVLGVILALPPIKQAMASRQMKSRYLEALLQRRRR